MLVPFEQSGGLFGTKKSQPKQEKTVPAASTATKPVPASKGEINYMKIVLDLLVSLNHEQAFLGTCEA